MSRSFRYLLAGGTMAAGGLYAGGIAYLLLWPAVSFGIVGVAYVAHHHGVFGKRLDGSFSPQRVALLLPYLLVTYGLWHLARLLVREPVCSEVARGIWVGRRPYAAELPTEVRLVVDLTAEFPVHRPVAISRRYICVPTLDSLAPKPQAFRDLLARLTAEESIYIHCAAGHGRSATLAAALLVERRIAETWQHAERIMRRHRPRIRINPRQRRFLDTLYHSWPHP